MQHAVALLPGQSLGLVSFPMLLWVWLEASGAWLWGGGARTRHNWAFAWLGEEGPIMTVCASGVVRGGVGGRPMRVLQ